MLAFAVMMAAVATSPIVLSDKSASQTMHQFQELNKVKQDALLALILSEINRAIKRPKRAVDMSGLPIPIPPRLQPDPYIFVLPATTPGSNNVYVAQFETSEKLALTTAVVPDLACKNCPGQLQKHEKMLSSGPIMSCCGALLEPVDPFPNEKKDIKKRVNFGHVYSYKWEKKRQSNGKRSGSLELPKLKILGSQAFQNSLLHKLLFHRIQQR